MEPLSLFASILRPFLIQGGFAVLCGAIIGIERERKGKPAGFRTNTLICFGSALYMFVGELMFQKMNVSVLDPTRIAAQVVTGIGFLGAGTIIQSRGTITGLTSAATIWVVAAIGLVIGAGYPLLGLLCTVLTLGTLVLLTKIEPKLLGKCHFVTCDVIFNDDGRQARAEIASILTEHDVDISKTDIQKIDKDRARLKINFCDKHPSHSRFLAELWHAAGVLEVTTEK